MNKEDVVTLVVLNDGETYSDVRGCSIVVVSAADAALLELGEKDIKDLHPLSEIGLNCIASKGWYSDDE